MFIPAVCALLMIVGTLCTFPLIQRAQAETPREQSARDVVERLFSQQKLKAEYRFDKNSGVATFLRSSEETGFPLQQQPFNKRPLVVADQFMEEYGAYFGLQNTKEELSFLKEQTDTIGMSHVRYNQRYQGVPVFGGQLIVHVDTSAAVQSANGHIVPNIAVDTQPTIFRTDAIRTAAQLFSEHFKTDGVEQTSPQLVIYNEGILNNNGTTPSQLAWMIELLNRSIRQSEIYFIDAHTGTLLRTTSRVKELNRNIYDCTSGSCVVSRSEGEGATNVDDVDALYDMLGDTHNFYVDTFGRNGANNAGGIGDDSWYGSALENTDGYTYLDYEPLYGSSCPNAWFDGFSVNFCHNLVYQDIVGHEYGHAIEYFSIPGLGEDENWYDYNGFWYHQESGALSEGFADIWGEATENYAKEQEGSENNDWLLGAETGASWLIRSMSDPTDYTSSLTYTPYPDRFYSENVYCGADDAEHDNGGIHHNNTIFSHAAYLTAMGGEFNGCTITGLGREKEEAIFYRAETAYLTYNATFNDAYDALIAACNDLYDAADCRELKKALQSVELDQAGACSNEPAVAPSCESLDTPATVTSITTTHVDGSYTIGEAITLNVSFSKNVTSTGNVTLTLETGATDRTCTFTVTDINNASCEYTVQAGDTTNDLDVISMTGTIIDADGNTLSSLVPTTGLAAQKDIVIDTTAPVLSITSLTTNAYVIGSEVITFTDDEMATPECSIDAAHWVSCTSNATTLNMLTGWNEMIDGVLTVSVHDTDAVQNIGTATVQVYKDTTAPTGKMTINKGKKKTTKKYVTLRITASDAGVGLWKMRFSNNGKKWSSWQTIKTTKKKWDLTKKKYGGTKKYGTKKVYVQLKDALGHVSKRKRDLIIYKKKL